MASLATSAVSRTKYLTLNQRLAERLIMKTFVLTLTGQGTVANAITAATLGFTKIHSCSNAVSDADDLIIVAAPSFDGSKLLLKAAGTNAPGDYTANVRITVFGR